MIEPVAQSRIIEEFFLLHLQVPAVQVRGGIDHAAVAAELQAATEHQQQTGKGDAAGGEQGAPAIAPEVAPGDHGVAPLRREYTVKSPSSSSISNCTLS